MTLAEPPLLRGTNTTSSIRIDYTKLFKRLGWGFGLSQTLHLVLKEGEEKISSLGF